MRQAICWLLLPAVLSCAPAADEPEEVPSVAPAASSTIEIEPTTSRLVHILHTGWNLRWAIKLPEAITSRNFRFMGDRLMQVDWRQQGDGSWQYVWRAPSEPAPTSEAQERRRRRRQRRLNTKRYAAGLAVQARIAAMDTGVILSLTLTNESTDTFHEVSSEGGCLQARNGQFRDHDEVGRTHIMLGGEMQSLGDLDRTLEVRCHYSTDFKFSRVGTADGYWGTSSVRIDSPVIIGARSRRGNRAVALGYEGSWSAMQNADGHHCIHSNPYFGDLEPGESVTRNGLILFGKEVGQVAGELARLLNESGVRLPDVADSAISE